MRGGAHALRSGSRRLFTFACIVGLSAVPFGVARAATTHLRGATARICNVATECPTIVAIAKPTASERIISRFLNELWTVNYDGGPSGTHHLQRCENPGPAPYRVACVLFSTGSVRDLSALRAEFLSSRLFVSVESSMRTPETSRPVLRRRFSLSNVTHPA